MTETLKSGLEQWNLPCDARVLELFQKYCGVLVSTNEQFNLTSITNPEDIASLHFLDSLALLRAADVKNKKILDVGSGAGFPGLPIKLIEPSIDLTLLDSHGKRVGFLSGLIQELGVTNVQCIHARAEEQSKLPGFRHAYDIAVSRAVADLRMLCELCMPFVRQGGLFLAMKSVGSDEEIQIADTAIASLGGKLEANFDYTIPGTEIRHRIVVIEKTAPTPDKYPRRFAKIQSDPL